MQHHPGSWYLPWAMPLQMQKMLAVPFQHPGGAAGALAAYAPAAASPNGGVTCQVISAAAQQHSPNSAAAVAAALQQAQNQNAAHSYPQHAAAAAALQSAAAAAASGQVPVAAAYNHNSAALHHAATNGGAPSSPVHPHQSAAAHQQQLHHQHAAAVAAAQLQHHQAQAQAQAQAAAMFTPLSLRTFLPPTSNQLAGLAAAQQSLTPCGPQVHQHHHQQNPMAGVTAAQAAAAAAAVAAAQQQMTCVPASTSPSLQQQQQQQQQQQAAQQHHQQQLQQQYNQHQRAVDQHQQLTAAAMNLNVGVVAMRHHPGVNGLNGMNGLSTGTTMLSMPIKKIISPCDKDKLKLQNPEKRKADDSEQVKDLKKAKLETKALKAKRPGFTDERYHETSYYIENGLRKVYPYYFTFTTFTKGRWVGEKILDVFAREFRAHPAEEYERCITTGTLTVNYEKVPIDYRLKHNDLLANIVHRHEVPVTSQPITIVHMDDDIVVVNKPASIPVHPCGRYRHNTVVFILAKEYNLKNLRTIHRLDRLTSGLLLFGRSPKKARQMEHQIRNRQVQKEYICRVEGDFPEGIIECKEPIEVVSYKIGVCKVSTRGKDCTTTFQKIAHNGKTSVVLCKPLTGRMHQIRVHLQYLGYPVVNDPLYNHEVFGPLKGRGGDIGGKTDEQLVSDLINIHNAENWLGIDGDSDMSLFKTIKGDCDAESLSGGVGGVKGNLLSDDDSETISREASPCSESPRPATTMIGGGGSDSPSGDLVAPTATAETGTNTSSLLPITSSSSTVASIINGVGGFANLTNSPSHVKVEVTVATQTGHESPDMMYNAEKMTADKHCYECKVRYRDPKPKDLVMYLHAWKYKGPGWEYETELPSWASTNWIEPEAAE